MQEAVIKRNIIIVLVLTFLILVGMIVAWNIVFIRPQKLAMAETETKYGERKSKADALPKALEEQQRAEDQREYLKGQLAFFRLRYRSMYFGDMDGTKPQNVAARTEAWRRWMNEYYQAYGAALISELRRSANTTGVRIVFKVPTVDQPPQTPEEVKIPPNGFLRPLNAAGPLAIELTGTLPTIMAFCNRLTRSSILMSVGNLNLQGYSPQIKATTTVVPYLLATGPTVKLQGAAPPPAEETAGAGAPGGMPGGGNEAPPAEGGGNEAPPADSGGGGGEETGGGLGGIKGRGSGGGDEG